MCSKLKHLAAVGTTVLVASGDNGVRIDGKQTCPPFRSDFLSACPFVTSVGATKLIGTNSTAEAAPDYFYSSGEF